MGKLSQVQEQCKEEALKSANKEPYTTVSVVARAEGRYDLVEEIKALIKEGDEDE